MTKEERAERAVMETGNAAGWDPSPYSLALEIKRLLAATIADAGAPIDSGHGVLWPFGASAPIEGHAEADLYVRIGGVEFWVTVRKSNAQLMREEVTAEQLGLPPEEPEG